MFWSLRVHVEWNAPAPGKGEQWWKFWKRSTGERMERDIEIDDTVFYLLTCLVWALSSVVR